MLPIRTIACLLMLVPGALAAQDPVPDNHPHRAYPGADIVSFRTPSLQQIVLPTGPVADEDRPDNLQRLQGTVTHADYRVRPATAPLQIARSYGTRLADAGFETVLSCTGAACGRDMGSLILNSGKVAPTGFADGLFNDGIQVIVARRGDEWSLLHIAEGPDRTAIYHAVVEDAVPVGG